jgi:DNA-directed RNA polymerase subunit A'
MKSFTKRVKRVEFSLQNPDEIRKISVCEVSEIDLYEKNNEPKFCGLNDTRMGPYDKNILCKTCKNNITVCPGHIGHIELAVPVYSCVYIEIVRKVLSNVCHCCSSILIDKNNNKIISSLNKKTPYKKFLFVQSYISSLKNKVCFNCNRMQYKYSRDGLSLNVVKQLKTGDCKEEKKIKFSAKEALQVLENISDEDIKLLGFNVEKSRPEWMILIDNDMKGIPPSQHRSGRSLKSFKERIKGKEGRFRGNLLGKRVDFSARSVVSPDPSISIDQLGVPFKICMKITFPEVVNYYNIKKLEKLIQNGPYKYPGANFIIRHRFDQETKLDLRYVKDSVELKYCDVVERHLLEDDVILFNRQPSLNSFL